MTKRPDAGARLTDLEHVILLAVLRLGDDAYGATIRRELARHAAPPPSLSTIYLTMLRLEERGLVRSEMAEPTPVRGGRSKRVFTVTAAGVSMLRATRASLHRLWRGLESVLGSAPGGTRG